MHILKERSSEDGIYRYSQARVYLFISLMFFFAMMTFITVKAFLPDMTMDIELLKEVLASLTFPITTFATYALGTKLVKTIKGKKNGETTTQQYPQE